VEAVRGCRAEVRRLLSVGGMALSASLSTEGAKLGRNRSGELWPGHLFPPTRGSQHGFLPSQM
jgi:hypothetical protein